MRRFVLYLLLVLTVGATLAYYLALAWLLQRGLRALWRLLGGR
jgi:hypothetical protein